MDEPKRYDIPVEHCVGLMPSSAGKWLHRDDPAIVQAIAIASAAREAGLVDEQGRFRKILGTLPITADGCVAGLNCTLWRWNRPAQEMMRMELFHADRRSHLIEPIPSRATICVDLCYSTRSAAERAVKEQSDGH